MFENEPVLPNVDLKDLDDSPTQWKEDRDFYKTEVDFLRLKLRQIYASPAWRISKPLRILNLIQRKFFPSSLEAIDSEELKILKDGPTVIDKTKNSLIFESEIKSFGEKPIAILAQWSATNKLSLSTINLVRELQKNEFDVMLVSACESDEALSFPEDISSSITIIRKPNYGYDFGSWSVGLSQIPSNCLENEILLINDSLVGPFTTIKNLVEQLRNSPFDITGLTDSLQTRYHIQSFMIHFKSGVLTNSKIKDFWLNIREQPKKQKVIQAYEIGFSRIAQLNGFYVGAIMPWNLVSNYWENPSVHGWKTLLERNVPFIKREVFRRLSEHDKEILIKYISRKFEVDKEEIEELFKSET